MLGYLVRLDEQFFCRAKMFRKIHPYVYEERRGPDNITEMRGRQQAYCCDSTKSQ